MVSVASCSRKRVPAVMSKNLAEIQHALAQHMCMCMNMHMRMYMYMCMYMCMCM